MMKILLLMLVTLLMVCTTGYSQDLRNSSRSNMTVEKIEKDGAIRDRSNRKLGEVNDDGDVMDSNNMQIGRVKADGTVVDRHNMTIGYAKGIPRSYAAAFFFFNMFK